MLATIGYFNIVVFILLGALYFYQAVYVAVVLFSKKKKAQEKVPEFHKYAVLVAARNESAVIGQLISSVKKQNYPPELVDIYVVADNCTDDTAEISQNAGATVYERFNRTEVGKGYALDYVLGRIEQEHADEGYEGYFVFDADNLLDPNYIREMNRLFDQGYRVVTSYRNSKNYGSNWISAGYSLWFLRESKYLNNARMLLGTSCAISGTGFLMHKDIVRKNNGWKHHLLTEDIEFSVDSVLQGEKIGYCGSAKLYDEQPCTWSQSWKQRLRWSKGFYQVCWHYGTRLLKGIFTGRSFAHYDMFMTVMPALFISLGSIGVNLLFLLFGLSSTKVAAVLVPLALRAIFMGFVNYYLILFSFGVLTTITEWREIHCRPVKKLLYTFTFPIFIFSYIPISIEALFRRIEWTPITHTIGTTIEEVHGASWAPSREGRRTA
ncbi:glycosyltransferase family 2 protein [Papillibacter cinnamivorans]|uniref:Glycosyltransferase, catalytic subunit of cellulose synthase and poly-beta-1,6-N-acetylglucosamine synthase n=1 Tax=Papillibacter cinnamivorans DSM 12816 TaxID=1122930 RepID=A0A1W2BX05_9FIRM|nr:glycosyltransferase family 2 protein [Papillibacter cinnamivorans]SMC77122.1 Glycosyltransferase, catalytic subunit of cellulose synthase and poly-beta-1,6-N-acetylglucosamine synthase [Papillibacter cinnamivorans DSM 12816]